MHAHAEAACCKSQSAKNSKVVRKTLLQAKSECACGEGEKCKSATHTGLAANPSFSAAENVTDMPTSASMAHIIRKQSSDHRKIARAPLISQRTGKVIQRSMQGYQDAMNETPPNYDEAAKHLNGESKKKIRYILDENLKGATTVKSRLYEGGRDKGGVGPCSNICRMTEEYYLQVNTGATPYDYRKCDPITLNVTDTLDSGGIIIFDVKVPVLEDRTKYCIVQWMKGCCVSANGEHCANIHYAQGVPYNFPDWVVDSTDTDPVYPGPVKSSKVPHWSYKKTSDGFQTQDAPNISTFSAVQFRTEVHQLKDVVPKFIGNDKPSLPTSIAEHRWQITDCDKERKPMNITGHCEIEGCKRPQE